jgi:hypothetical protein
VSITSIAEFAENQRFVIDDENGPHAQPPTLLLKATPGVQLCFIAGAPVMRIDRRFGGIMQRPIAQLRLFRNKIRHGRGLHRCAHPRVRADLIAAVADM